MLVYGRNVAKDILKKGEKVEKIFLQENFNDKEIISLIENSKIVVFYKKKREIKLKSTQKNSFSSKFNLLVNMKLMILMKRYLMELMY